MSIEQSLVVGSANYARSQSRFAVGFADEQGVPLARRHSGIEGGRVLGSREEDYPDAIPT